MSREQFIENNVIRNRAQLGYGDSLFIRRCRAGLGFGVVDVLLLPLGGPQRVVLIEAKQQTSPDAMAKVVGQLLLYYAGLLQVGLRGIRMMREYACVNARRARSPTPKSLKMLTKGISPRNLAWSELLKGRKLHPSQVGMFVALDGLPKAGLKAALTTLANRHALSIGVISVLGRDNLQVWHPA